MLDGRNQAHLFRLAVHHGQEDHAEALLHLGVLEQLVQDDLGLGAALEFDHNAHAGAVGFVANVGNVANRLVVHQLGDAFDQARFVHLIRNFSNDNRLAFLVDVLNGGAGAHHKAAAATLICVQNAAAAVNDAGGREIRTFDELQNLWQRSGWRIHQRDGRIHDLRQIVRRNVSGHADGDAIGAVDQQVGNLGRQDHRLGAGIVEILDKIHRVFINVGD